jgi:hypothetical protein
MDRQTTAFTRHYFICLTFPCEPEHSWGEEEARVLNVYLLLCLSAIIRNISIKLIERLLLLVQPCLTDEYICYKPKIIARWLALRLRPPVVEILRWQKVVARYGLFL